MSLEAFSRVCEATITGLSRILNQGIRDKSVEVLSNPQIFLDKELFLSYLFFWINDTHFYILYCNLMKFQNSAEPQYQK